MTAAAFDFDAQFDGFRETAFRYEGRPVYRVGGAEQQRIDAWRAGDPRPERSVRTEPWLQRIARTTLIDGKRWTRVRVVDDPLPEYLRYELTGLVENQAAGDRTLMLDRGQAPVDIDHDDFWLFDSDTPNAVAVWLRYRQDGTFRGIEVERSPVVLERLRGVERDATAAAVPLNDWLAGSVGELRGADA